MPAGRITVVLGSAGGGKTIFALQTLITGVRDFGEPGVFVAFEESVDQVFENGASFDWGLDGLRDKSIAVLDANLPQSVVKGGEFDLLGLLAVLGHKVKTVRAKRIVLDGIDVLLAHLGDPLLARREVFRLREWLQDNGLTAIITAKASAADVHLSREYDFMQFMADCTVKMHHRVFAGTAERFIRVAKCRGGPHSANEFPFTIGSSGIEVGSGASTEISHPVSTARISSGVERLDVMLGGGYYRGSSTLITGSPGTAKTTLAAAFASAACHRRERTLFISFDEAPALIVRNMRSVGIPLGQHVESGVLRMHSFRSRAASPEAHAAHIRDLLRVHKARNLVIDPISALGPRSEDNVAQLAVVEILDVTKSQSITGVYTSLLGNNGALTEESPIGISTIADTWMHVSYVSQGGERNRALTIIKSRGTAHSSQVRELVLSKEGLTLADVYSAGGEVLMGTLRWEREDQERRERDAAKRQLDLRKKEAALALAETRARTQTALSAQAVQEAIVDRLNAEREEIDAQAASHHLEVRERRGADDLRVRRTRGTRGSAR